MKARWPWSVLGIAPTDDRAAIRSAYAARLKAMDPDADPAGYQKLREAREAALDRDFQPSGGAQRSDPVSALATDAVAVGDAPLGDIGDENAIPWEPVEPVLPDPNAVALEQHHEALADLLFVDEAKSGEIDDDDDDDDHHEEDTHGAPLPDEAEVRAMTEHAEAILANPLLGSVDNLADSSNWFAGALAATSPRSDCLLKLAENFFHWGAIEEIGRTPAQAYIVDRLAAFDFADQLAQSSHPLHGAWRELTKPAGKRSRRGWVRSKRIDELLSLIHTRYPTLEALVDPRRLEMWQTKQSRPAIGRLIFFALLFFGQILRFCASHYDTKPSPAPAPVAARKH